MDKPEALRLAEELERAKKWGCPAVVIEASADELRRLHAQRDALLEALKKIARRAPCIDVDIARAAIAALEGEAK